MHNSQYKDSHRFSFDVISCVSSDDESDNEEERTLFVANLDDRVTVELLYELFLQAGPVESARIPKDNSGRQRTFGFITYAQKCSIPYAIRLLSGLQLFRKVIVIRLKENSNSQNQQRRSYPPDIHPIINEQNYNSSLFQIGPATTVLSRQNDLTPHVNPFKQDLENLVLLNSSSGSSIIIHDDKQNKRVETAVESAIVDWTKGNVEIPSRYGKNVTKYTSTAHNASPYYRGNDSSSTCSRNVKDFNSNRRHRNKSDRRSDQRNHRHRRR